MLEDEGAGAVDDDAPSEEDPRTETVSSSLAAMGLAGVGARAVGRRRCVPFPLGGDGGSGVFRADRGTDTELVDAGDAVGPVVAADLSTTLSLRSSALWVLGGRGGTGSSGCRSSGMCPVSDIGAGVPARLASLSMFACWISSGSKRSS